MKYKFEIRDLFYGYGKAGKTQDEAIVDLLNEYINKENIELVQVLKTNSGYEGGYLKVLYKEFIQSEVNE